MMDDDINPFEQFHAACYRAYAERMAVATRISMSRNTMYAFVKHWPPYTYSAGDTQLLGTRVRQLAVPPGDLVDVTEDNTIPYGLVYVTFTNPHNRPANHNEVVKVAKI